jgi:hypothetical protein
LNIHAAEIFFSPDMKLGLDSAGCRMIFDHGLLKAFCRPEDDIYFWDYNSFEKIPGCNNKTGDR